MVSKKVTIINPSGVHARPASILSKAATECSSEVLIIHGEKKIQPKSILNLMAAALKKGTEIEVQCSGENEEEDLKKITGLIESGLGE